jgi:nitrogen fixation/metabolism regulation signal transduction histidine kinase
MISKNFRLILVLHTLVLIGTITVFIYLLLNTELYVTTVVSGLLIAVFIYTLARHVEKSNRDLTQFLLSIKYNDFTTTFSKQNLGRTFDELRLVFNDVLAKFHHLRTEKEEDLHYLQTVVDHIPVGLLALDPGGKVVLTNPMSKKLLGVARLRYLSELRNNHQLSEALTTLQAGEKTVVVANRFDEKAHLSLSATRLRRRGEMIKLVTLQNISSELAEREMEAWQQLVRVLTHEIMNSVTPIASLSSTINHMLQGIGAGNRPEADSIAISTETLNDMQSAAGAVEKRGEGLIHFIEAYQNLSRVHTPDFRIVPVRELFEQMRQLILSREDSGDTHVIIDVDPDGLEVTADPDLIEQVLLNLSINALQALKGQGDGTITLNGRMKKGGGVMIQIIDNGPGIQGEALDKLFVPFFTTRQDGTGIGLSLSRQIMRMHNGDITVSSKPREQTVFTLHF